MAAEEVEQPDWLPDVSFTYPRLNSEQFQNFYFQALIVIIRGIHKNDN